MHADTILAYVAVAGAVVTVLGGGGVLGWWWRKQPQREEERARNTAVAVAILGEPAVPDRSGAELQPARPGLVHRVGTLEEAVVEFRHTLGLLTETLKRLDEHERRLGELERARTERALAQAESAQMWRAVADRDVLDSDADDED